jgi:hypothetical protein
LLRPRRTHRIETDAIATDPSHRIASVITTSRPLELARAAPLKHDGSAAVLTDDRLAC